MQLIHGKMHSAQKVVIYGPEGIGKSSFAACFPRPVFIDTEGSTKHLSVARTPKPTSFSVVIEQVRYFISHTQELETLVIDTADWAEQLCMVDLCAKAQKSGIEDFGYGKGYTYLAEDFGKLLNLLEELIECGVNVVVTAHAKMRKFEQPDEMGAYDRWELKLQKTTAPLLKEWADMVLFTNYETITIKRDDGKVKAQGGGKRVMYTSHHACWDAKNRHGLAEKLPLAFDSIASCIPSREAPAQHTKETPVSAQTQDEAQTASTTGSAAESLPAHLKTLYALLDSIGAQEAELRNVVAGAGYFPADMAVEHYPEDFVTGKLIAGWERVSELLLEMRPLPF